jgi:ferredoxin--NADP+ reductase
VAISRPLRVAIVGAGPSGIYSSEVLAKSGVDVSIDLFETLPAPFGLLRYGVAPDHPRIKGIQVALTKILAGGDVRLIANVTYGTDISLAELRRFYDAVVFTTGAMIDGALRIPGIDLDGSFGAADFVSWYNGHPDAPRTWPLSAKSVAVLGAGNVALDVARILARPLDELLPTDIPVNVVEGLRTSPVTDVHIFARRGPVQAKFTPLELRELEHVGDMDIVLNPADYEGLDVEAIDDKRQKQVVQTLLDWAARGSVPLDDKGRRMHIHFFESPAELLGSGKVEALRTERTAVQADGSIRGTGEFHDWPVQAVYRAVGTVGEPLPELPFDAAKGVIANVAGRVVDESGAPIPGTYTVGWIKRGASGVIGNSRPDAVETMGCLVEDAQAAGSAAFTAEDGDPQAILDFLGAKGVEYVEWHHWEALDTHEQALGAQLGRGARVKLVDRAEMVAVSHGR